MGSTRLVVYPKRVCRRNVICACCWEAMAMQVCVYNMVIDSKRVRR